MFVTLRSRKKSSVIWVEHHLRTEFQEEWILVQPKAPRARVRRNFDELLSQAVHARNFFLQLIAWLPAEDRSVVSIQATQGALGDRGSGWGTG